MLNDYWTMASVNEGRCNLGKCATASKDDDAVKNWTTTNRNPSSGIEGQAWVEKFKTMCLTYRFSTDSLTNLMTYYARNIRSNVNECQTKPLKAEKLKDFISGTLLFFLYCYRAQGEDSDCAAYMDIMSDLLAMYIDMELKASKRTTEAHSNISARLTSYLYVCLDNSTEHLLDTLLKVQFMSSTYLQILDPLIEKILRIVPKNPTNGTMYVRYFLLYRIWKRINKDSAAKNQINARARQSMRLSPSKLSEYLINNVLPKVPINQKINTEILLLQKFDLEKSCENFIKFTRDSRCSTNAQLSESTKPEDNSPDNSNDKNKSTTIPNNSNSIVNSITSKAKITRRIPKKLGEVVLIDLTNDEASGKVLKSKKKSKKRLSWLQEIAKRRGQQPSNNTKEDNITEDIEKLDLSLFVTSDASMLIEEHNHPQHHQETETSVLIDNLRLDTKCDGKLTVSSVVSNEPELNEPNNHTSLESTALIPLDNKIEHEIRTLKSEIKVQMEVHHNNELDKRMTEINELNNELCENLKNEINDDTKFKSTNLDNSYQRDTVLHINQNIQSDRNEISLSSINQRNVEFQEQHIDGLSLLASVSQRVSHLSTDSPTTSTNNIREIIKVKDPKSLTIFSDTDNQISTNVSTTESLNNSILEIYPDDDIDKVASHVEVSSSEDVYDNNCTSTVYHPQTFDNLQNEMVNDCPNTLVDSSIHSEKEETNVILNGETIFLLQKSPNSNLYIINKAVENREDEDCNNLNDKNIQKLESVDDNAYSYEIYDKLYRMNQANSAQAFDDTRRTSQKVKTTVKDNTRVLDLKKSEIKKQTSSLELKSPRRHRIKQEYDTCTSDLVDTHALHIPPSSIYHSNYSTSELYISCRQNCASVTCSLPVNHPTKAIHPIPNSPRCTCLNCRYDIVTHCTQCIIPPNDGQQKTAIDGSYYIEIQPSSVIKDCKGKHDTDVNIYDDKTIYKMEINKEGINDKQGTFMKNENNSKLPLKKRFSMMSSCFENVNVKTENKSINYPNTPMLSIAALETNSNSQLSNKMRNNSGDYVKDSIINGYQYNEDGKRKRTCLTANATTKIRKTSTDSGQISRPSKKVQEPKSPSKNSKRQTRLSQRKVPRVNYSYPDNETECNPSVESKRKRKKANR